MLFQGSGKTFTMCGPNGDPGIIPRTIEYIYAHSLSNAASWSHEFQLSMIEIYNSELYDLLEPSRKPKIAGDIIEGMAKKAMRDEQDMLQLWSKGIQNRRTASTMGNERSSRSHSLTILHLTYGQQNENHNATVTLVDLAGSESPIDSQNMEETKFINSSLSALKGVLENLKKQMPVVDFKQSILTKVLKPSLTGNSKAMLITNLTTSKDEIKAAINTSNFANLMRSI